MVLHEGGGRRIKSLRAAWATYQVWGHTRHMSSYETGHMSHSETLWGKKERKRKKRKGKIYQQLSAVGDKISSALLGSLAWYLKVINL
jgi:hypothetical protein